MKITKLTIGSVAAVSLVSVAPLCHADFISDLFSSSSKNPVELSETTVQSLESSPVWLIDGKNSSSWTLKKKGSSYQFSRTNGPTNMVSTQIDAGSVARTTEKVSLGRPNSVSANKNGSLRISYGNPKAPVLIDLQLKAYDVSGLKMSNYLLNRQGTPSVESERVGGATFPKGSIAYKPTLTFVNAEMVLPVNENFTNAKSPKELVENFSSVPFCLRRHGGHAYGIVFDKKSANAKSGTFEITPVKTTTMFCTPTGERAVAKGQWNLVSTGKSQAVVMNMPNEVTPFEYFMEPQETAVSKMAFVSPAKGDHVFRPGKYFAQGSTIVGNRYLFNSVAAKAIMDGAGM